MTSKERMLRALNREQPDRLPVTVHQWQDYHLNKYMGGSDTLISPAMHAEFCLPYDREIHRALHQAGHLATYHTCGGMMHILDLILQNETDASETLTPRGIGGNITDPSKVHEQFHGKLAMIGGMNQFDILTNGDAETITREVQRLFEGFGPDGGYIMSASDHFFDTPPENLRAFAAAARTCRYP